MKLLSVICALAALGLSAGSARAQKMRTYFKTGEDLLIACKRPHDNNCAGYLQGVVDAVGALQFANVAPARLCVPEGASAQSIIDIVVKQLNDNPKDRWRPAADLVIPAVVAAWPCPK